MATEERSGTFCILPWIHLAVFPEGSARLCCVAEEPAKDKTLSLQSHSLPDVWNSEYMRDARRKMLDGRPVKDCRQCYHLERTMDGHSNRTAANDKWRRELGPRFDSIVEQATKRDHVAPQLPLYYQLMPGNVCNLKCRMCFPTFSSMIERDPVHSRWWPPTRSIPAPTVPRAIGTPVAAAEPLARVPEGPWYRDDAWVRDVLLQNSQDLKSLYFTGGEPMIEKQVENIVDHLIAQGAAGNMTLEFNTNGTVLRESMLEKLLHFKLDIGLSLDAYGRYHEYIRYPAKWDAIHRNVERLASLRGERLSLSGGSVLTAYNVLNVVDVLRYFDERGIHHKLLVAATPWFMTVTVLPARVRHLAAQRLRAYAAQSAGLPEYVRAHVVSTASYLESLPEKATPASLRTLMLFTNDLDAGRQQSFRDVHGELVDLLRQDGFEWTDERPPAGWAGPHAPTGPRSTIRKVRRWAGRVARRLIAAAPRSGNGGTAERT